MTDADRLREAADRLDEAVRYAGDNPGMSSWAAQCGATAAVLRAVAHEWDLFGHPMHGIKTQPAHWDSLAHVATPALALADTILERQR